jgi:hypothetical protein
MSQAFNYVLWDICMASQKMFILFQVLHGLRTCENRWTVISHWTIHFKFIWVGTDIIT